MAQELLLDSDFKTKKTKKLLVWYTASVYGRPSLEKIGLMVGMITINVFFDCWGEPEIME